MLADRLRMAAGSAVAYTADAARFDGTNDYATRASDLTGNSDTDTGLLSFWFYFQGSNGSRQDIFRNNSIRFLLYKSTGNIIEIVCRNSGDGNLLVIDTTSTFSTVSNPGWHHMAASWDLSAGTAQLYIDGSSNISIITNTNGTIDYTDSNWGFGSNLGTGNKINADVFDFYFTNTFLDLSVAANLQKFRSSAGKPVYLGLNGELPTGAQPLVFFHLNDGETANNFVANDGEGGAFTVTGTLTTAPTSPTD